LYSAFSHACLKACTVSKTNLLWSSLNSRS
jgi:hypothetical protein